MNRLAEVIVPFGLRMACRRASWPTRRSPWSVKATTEGVVRDPSALAITVGSPPSRTAITELVVPRSIPTALAICVPHLHRDRAESSAPGGWSLREAAGHDREARQQGKAAVVADARGGQISSESGWRLGHRARGQTSSCYSPDVQQLPSERTEATHLPAAAAPQTAIHPPSPRWQQSSTTRQLWRQALI